MKKTIVVTVLGILTFLSSAHAQPLNITVYDAQYTVDVQATEHIYGGPYSSFERMTIVSTPISDEIDVMYLGGGTMGPTTCRSVASSDLFSVYTYTGWGQAYASATSRLQFSPLEDKTQTFVIALAGMTGRGDWFSLTLRDLTTDSTLWNYGWAFYYDPETYRPVG